jgi:hypothetical protein
MQDSSAIAPVKQRKFGAKNVNSGAQTFWQYA